MEIVRSRMVSAMTHRSVVEGLEQPRIACDDGSGDDIRIAKLDYMPTVAVDRRRSRTVLAETGSGGAAGRQFYRLVQATVSIARINATVLLRSGNWQSRPS